MSNSLVALDAAQSLFTKSVAPEFQVPKNDQAALAQPCSERFQYRLPGYKRSTMFAGQSMGERVRDVGMLDDLGWTGRA